MFRRMVRKFFEYEHAASNMIDRISGGSLAIGRREFSSLFRRACSTRHSIVKCSSRWVRVEFIASRCSISSTENRLLEEICDCGQEVTLTVPQREKDRSSHTFFGTTEIHLETPLKYRR